MKDAWTGLKKITGMVETAKTTVVDDAKQYCNDLVKFYSRFDVHDFRDKCSDMVNTLRNSVAERVIVSTDDVLKSFAKIKINKAGGPDKLNGKVLKLGKEALASIFQIIFQRSLDEGYVPTKWKLSEIVPLPKKPHPTILNDFRPVALTSIPMKCLERIVKLKLMSDIGTQQDPLQFAYTRNRSTLDPTVMIAHDVLKYLDVPNNKANSRYIRVLFIDFSSAFNTIQIHIMLDRLKDMKVNKNIILWIYSFLSHRQQYVKFNGNFSETVYTETGAPQGCVLSPLLFTLYTNTCRSGSPVCKVYKYADDTALIGFCCNNDDQYQLEVTNFVKWCSENYLLLNVQKTKEIIIDFRKNQTHDNITINNETVEIVPSYKYLGTYIDCKLKFEENVNAIYKKANKRMYFVRKLHSLHVNRKILELFYKSVVESVFMFGIAAWYGNCTQRSKYLLFRITKYARKLGIQNVNTPDQLYEKAIVKKAKAVRSDCEHPLYSMYKLLRSGRRLQAEYTRTTRYSNSFLPSSIKLLNNIGNL